MKTSRSIQIEVSHPKKKRSRMKVFLIFSIIVCILMAIPLALIIVFLLNSNNKAAVNDQKRPSVLAEESPSQLKWWDSNWQNFQGITIKNDTEKALRENVVIMIKMNHKELVNKNISVNNGSDLRIVYQNYQEELTSIGYRIENPNSTDTKIYFQVQNAIGANSENNRYFLYFNNLSAEMPKDDISIDKNNPSKDAKTSLENIVEPPFAISKTRKWYLLGKELPSEYTNLTTTVTLNDKFRSNSSATINWEINGTNKSASVIPVQGSSMPQISADLSTLPPGDYTFAIKYNNYTKNYPFKLSYPLYATWTIDWEGYDTADKHLANMAKLSNDNEMPMTHFFNARIYEAPEVSEKRREDLTKWIVNRQAKGDEIAMHIHMIYDLVQASGVTPRTEPNWSRNGDGRDVPTNAYPPEEFSQIVQWSLDQFQKRGLGKPVGYRAAGWFINIDNLKVLDNLGFGYDSSGREDYIWGLNKMPGLWKGINSSTRPYQINLTNQNSGASPTLKLWEFPNNGSESTNIPVQNMLNKYNDNFKGNVIKNRQVLTFLSHAHWFDTDKPKMEKLFQTMGQNLAKNDGGPVIYTTLSKMHTLYNQK